MLVRARLFSFALVLGTSTLVRAAGADASLVPIVTAPVPIVPVVAAPAAIATPVLASTGGVASVPVSVVAVPVVDPAVCAAAGPFVCSFFYRRVQAHAALGHYTNPYYLTEPGRAAATLEADCAAARSAPYTEATAAMTYFYVNGAPERAFMVSSCRNTTTAAVPMATPAPVAVVSTPTVATPTCASTPGAAHAACRLRPPVPASKPRT